MATKYLINNVRYGSNIFYAGTTYDTTNDSALITNLESAGGVLILDPTGALATASIIAQTLRSRGAPPEESQAVMIASGVSSASVASVPTTRTLTAGAGMTGGGTLAANRTFDVGAGSGIAVNANDVAVVFGLVGEMAAAGVAAANAVGVVAKSAPIDHVHVHGVQVIGNGTDHAVATNALAGFMSATDKARFDTMQAGTGTLIAGTVTISGVTITASSRIQVTMKDPGAGAITGFASFSVPVGTRVLGVGIGTFDVNAIDDAQAVIVTAVCTFDWSIQN